MRIRPINNDYILVNNHKSKLSDESCRKVYFYRDYVIKIEYIGDIIAGGQCKKEVTLWKQLDSQDRKYFAPIIQHRFLKDRDYIVQPKLNFGKYTNLYKKKCFNNIIQPLAEKYNLEDVDEEYNWDVLKNGKPIIYDYGF